MAGKMDIEKAVKDIVELFARADGVKVQLEKETKEAEGLRTENKELQEAIEKTRKRKDTALANRRKVEIETEKDIAYYKRDAKSYKNIADKKRKEVFEEMQADIDKAVADHKTMLDENKELEQKIKDTKLKLQQVKEGIIT